MSTAKTTPKTARKTTRQAAVKTSPRPPAKPPVRATATATAKAAPTAPPQVPAKPPKAKAKLVRDSFTMPQADFDLIAALKARAIEFKRPAKKSELLRAGLQVLSALNDTALRAALDSLAPIKPGRPKKSD